ncbi:FIST N-terminal domain-containing protein [Azospirillum sp. TSO22-1]|uniref:FIST signal transduction protein n=1 Tax=Azospirillum sp. TSO22-1 TaxID=716789 RepID=UPI000D608E93|nr:FIST N-terminal domain-containing protein [Azospirillum sp. TSO22-1]PWC52932.1 histidine kinase [Azospirillum sp. TSO22-1]
MGTTTATRFHAASAVGPDWGQTVKACLDKLGDVRGCNLGFLYVTDSLAEQASSILNLLRGVTGIRDWVGSVGIGVLGGGEELFDQPAIAVMAARLPEESFRVFPVVSGDLEPMRRVAGGWLDRNGATLGLVHADPRNADLPDLATRLGEATGAFLVGGLASSRGEYPQFSVPASSATMTAPKIKEGPVGDGGVSGVLFGNGLEVATGLTQGCSPIGPMRTISAAEENLIIEIDGRPALEVFKEDIGELLARDLNRVAGYIFAGLPIAGSDTADYLVRDIIAIDARMGWLAVGERVEPGRRILFTRRDRQSAVLDMERMLEKLKKRLSGPPKGGVYVSCVARGPNFFGEGNQEVAMIQRALGEFPLAGFFANGEISNARLYGYTGVLTLFL